ncbi:PAS domain S-box protein [Nibricoccus aquaticus]|uniref:PAS domain S-box protein n=1 Tax=Nibricoccus aquaticus TaxID=2576891 RepID=UPI001586B672|nr:PAS domain S-box protein [Nibricoccus aquaticus]
MTSITPNPFSPELLQPLGPLHAVLEASPVALVAVDRRARIRLANAEAERLSGWSREELMTLPLGSLMPGRLHERLAVFLEEFFTEPKARPFGSAPDLCLVRRDGAELPVEMGFSPLYLGDQAFVLAAITDLGARRKAEREEAARQQRTRAQSAALMELVGDAASAVGDFEAGARRLTELAAVAVGVDQASVWLLDDFGRTLVCADVYAREAKAHGAEQSLSRDFYPAYFAAIQNEKSVAIADAGADARVAEMVANYFAPHGIGATLDAPIRIRGYVAGVLCLEHKGGAREWTADEQAFAGSLADQATQLLLHVEHTKAEQSARDATERLQEIFAHTTEAIFSLRVTPAKEFIYEEFNPAASAASGVPSIKACGRRPQDVMPAATAAQLNANYRRCLEEGRPIEYIETVGFGAGSGTYSTFLIPIRDAGGRIHRIAGFARDVTEQQRAERAVQASEEKFSKAFRSSPDAISVSDAANGVFMEVNEGFERLFACKASEVIGKSSRELNLWATPEDRERLLGALKAKGSVKNFEAMARPKSGAPRPCVLAAETVEIGGRMCLVLVIRDVTEQRAAEQALRESEARFRSYFESPLIGMAITAPDKRWLEVNDQLCRMLGYTQEELRGMTWGELTVEDDLAANEDSLKRALAGQLETYAMDKRYRRKDGEIVHASIAVRCIRKPDGAVDYFLTVVQDQTARIEAEQAQAELESQLRQAQKLEALGQLAGGIAHDFNNILTAIMAYAELAAMDLDNPDEVRQHLDQVQKASNRARDLVRRILTFSRQRKQERKAVPLTPVIEEAVNLVRSTLPAAIEIAVKIAADAPVVLADLSQIHQVLMNLCTNSAHAMRDRPGRLSVVLERVTVDAALVRAQPELREGSYARLTVSDTGSGMAPGVLKRVFEPFFTTKAPGEGTGLGLSVVHGIMQDHEGAVTVESELGKGTTFRLYFPEQIGVEEAVTAGGSPMLRGKGERVMFIDDELALCDSTRQLLDKLGYRTTALSSPVAALERFREAPGDFDIVITDLSMPFMTGVDVGKEMLALRPELPVVLASGFSGTWTAEKVREQGLRDLLIKPLTAAALSAAIRRVLDERRAGEIRR